MTLLVQGDGNIRKMAVHYGLKASFGGGETHK